MASSTTTPFQTFKVHKVPSYSLWKTQYNNNNIGDNDLVIVPPEVLLPAPTSNGTNGQFLQTDGNGNVSWATINTFPTQAGNSGKFLTTDGSTVSWATVDALPSQNGNSGKYLTTNGSVASWGAAKDTEELLIDNYPTPTSRNLITSRGVYAAISDNLSHYQPKINVVGILQSDGATITSVPVGEPGTIATLNSYGKVEAQQITAKNKILAYSLYSLLEEDNGCRLLIEGLADGQSTIIYLTNIFAGFEVEIVNYHENRPVKIIVPDGFFLNGQAGADDGSYYVTLSNKYDVAVLTTLAPKDWLVKGDVS